MLRWTWPWAPSNSSLSRLPSNSACANRETGFSVHTHTPMSHKTTPQDQIRNTHHVTHTHPCRTKRHPRNTHHVVHTRVLPPSAINCKGRGAVLVQGGHLFLILAFRNEDLIPARYLSRCLVRQETGQNWATIANSQGAGRRHIISSSGDHRDLRWHANPL